MKYRGMVLLAIMLMMAALPAQSQIIKKGQVGFRFLENPISAEAVGRGALGVATARTANAAFWNPAGLAWIDGRWDVALNYTKGIADINHTSAAAAVALPRVGTICVNAIMMDYGEFYGTRRADNEHGFIDTGVFSPSAWCLGIAFAQRVSDRFSYGVHLKYAYQDLGDAWVATAGSDVNDPNLVIAQKSYAHGEPAVDVGAVYDFAYHGIRFGAVIQNVSREIRYERDKFPLPFAVSFALSVNPLSFLLVDLQEHDLQIGFESRHPRDFKEKLKVGAEYTLHETLTVRLGYMGNYDERGLTAGIGLRQSWGGSTMRIDYAFQDFGLFNSVHLFTFGISH
ncbi:MAG: PorV/PorQ family protein [candidate division KSB1 bacterium]|nr:PorV/PorQ family protein [candidate division KSB1 bacterium]